MSRFSFIFFSILLLAGLYGEMVLEAAKPYTIIYTLSTVSIAYCVVALLLALIYLLHWFLNDDGEIIRTCLTFFNGAWIIGLLTYVVIKCISGQWHIGSFGHIAI